MIKEDRSDFITIRSALLIFCSIFIVYFISISSSAYAADVTLAWDPSPSPDIAGYKIYYKTGVSGDPYDGSGADQGPSGIVVPLADLDSTSQPTFVLSGLDNSQDYFIVATAFDEWGMESDYSNEVTFNSGVDIDAPAVPSGLSGVAISSSRIDLIWNASTDIGGSGLGGYRIYRNGIYIAETTLATFSDIGLIELTSYTYSVIAFDNNNNESTHSDSLIITTLPMPQCTITATAGANGSISPSGTITVNYGSTQIFTIAPNTNYRIIDVVVDGVSQGPIGFYTFTNVTMDHTIWVSFAPETRTITVTSDTKGSISPAGTATVNYGSSQTFTIAPDTNYDIADVVVDGASVGPVSTYTFSNVTANHTISASFSLQTRTIIATAGTNGTISPTGTITVNYGASQKFTIAPDANYDIADVAVDGVSAGAVSSYTFMNVTTSHTISVLFEVENQSPLANAGPDQNVNEGVQVILNGKNSMDQDDGIASFFWEQISGNPVELSNPHEPETNFFAPVVSTDGEALIFRLTVTDHSGFQHSDRCIVNVSWQNVPPVANAGSDITVGEGITVFLDASNSADEDNGISTYQWNQFSGTPVILSDPNAVQPSFISPRVNQEGESLKFELTVSDSGGLKAQDTCIVNISWQNNTPVASAGTDQMVDSESIVVLNGSGSYDMDSDTLTYYWVQTGGIPVTLSDPTGEAPYFTAPDILSDRVTLSFELIVSDQKGLFHSDSCRVDVYTFTGDLDLDGVIDCTDYLEFAISFNSCSGSMNYIPEADADGDGCITHADRDILYPSGVKICDLSVEIKNAKIRLYWTHTGADAYNIYRKIEGSDYIYIDNTTSTISTYLDRSVRNGMSYHYVITGVANGIESEYSNEIIATPGVPSKVK